MEHPYQRHGMFVWADQFREKEFRRNEGHYAGNANKILRRNDGD